mmetsp:Transcript_11140/g.32275  ORF Transcript_11140/g.32275 Transcript_11140/m.32275 type:complete len:401 (-) Transcript_11140:516-1718(-)
MHKQQLPQELELADAEVSGPDGLQPLPARDAHPHMCGQDHAHVVGAVTDGQRHRLALEGAALTHQLGLLLGRYSARYYRCAVPGEFEEAPPELPVFQSDAQRLTAHSQCHARVPQQTASQRPTPSTTRRTAPPLQCARQLTRNALRPRHARRRLHKATLSSNEWADTDVARWFEHDGREGPGERLVDVAHAAGPVDPRLLLLIDFDRDGCPVTVPLSVSVDGMSVRLFWCERREGGEGGDGRRGGVGAVPVLLLMWLWWLWRLWLLCAVCGAVPCVGEGRRGRRGRGGGSRQTQPIRRFTGEGLEESSWLPCGGVSSGGCTPQHASRSVPRLPLARPPFPLQYLVDLAHRDQPGTTAEGMRRGLATGTPPTTTALLPGCAEGHGAAHVVGCCRCRLPSDS